MTAPEDKATQPRRRASPDYLPRQHILFDVHGRLCSYCGGALHLGESVSEMLDWVPAQLHVVRTTRPKYTCRACNTVAYSGAPERFIDGGLATLALLSHILISKYCNHSSPYRQSQIAHYGIDLCRSTLAG